MTLSKNSGQLPLRKFVRMCGKTNVLGNKFLNQIPLECIGYRLSNLDRTTIARVLCSEL